MDLYSLSFDKKLIIITDITLSKDEIIGCTLALVLSCAPLQMSVHDRRQSLHLVEHCKPYCPSQCPGPFSLHVATPKHMHKMLASYPAAPTSVSISLSVLWVLWTL